MLGAFVARAMNKAASHRAFLLVIRECHEDRERIASEFIRFIVFTSITGGCIRHPRYARRFCVFHLPNSSFFTDRVTALRACVFAHEVSTIY